MQFHRCFWLLAGSFLFLPLATGCSGGATLGKVNGKVTADGQPVTEGQIQFSPAAGAQGASPAVGVVNADGTFTLTTKSPGDGAAIGKHVVSYSAPADKQDPWDGYGTAPPVTASAFKGMSAKTAEVEVKSGANDITIELAPAPK